MAMFHPSRSSGCLALAVAICFLLPGCFSDQYKTALEIFERACHCFDDHNVYNECNEKFRLSVEGAFHVGKESVDEYCGGPCFSETELALQCVEGIADESFKFSNGASVPAVKEALSTGCSYTPERGAFGTFEIRERKECGDEYHQTYHRHEQEQPGYGEESEQQYQGGGDCYGGAGRTGLRGLLPMLLLFFLVSSTLLHAI